MRFTLIHWRPLENCASKLPLSLFISMCDVSPKQALYKAVENLQYPNRYFFFISILNSRRALVSSEVLIISFASSFRPRFFRITTMIDSMLSRQSSIVSMNLSSRSRSRFSKKSWRGTAKMAFSRIFIPSSEVTLCLSYSYFWRANITSALSILAQSWSISWRWRMMSSSIPFRSSSRWISPRRL